MISFIKGRLLACGYAFKGLLLLVREPSIMVQLAIFALLVSFGFYFNITRQEWMTQLLLVGLVLGLEGLNTAIEQLADYVEPNHHKTIGLVKDIAAGAVGVAVFIGLIVLGIIYYPYVALRF